MQKREGLKTLFLLKFFLLSVDFLFLCGDN